MLPLLVAQPKLKKGTAPAGVIRSIAEALGEYALPYAGIYFQFSHDSEAVLDRIVKQLPLLEQFRRPAGEGALPQNPTIANLAIAPGTDRLVEPMPLTVELLDGLCAVAEGVPRRFPVQQFTIIFSKIAWGTEWQTELPEEYVVRNDRMPPMFAAMVRFTSSITYSNMWWVSGRKQSLDIKLVGKPLGAEARAPAVPEQALAALNRITPLKAKAFSLLPLSPTGSAPPSPATSDQHHRCVSLTRAAGAALAARVKEKRLPHALLTDSEAQLAAERETGIPKREILSAALRPLGYRHSGKLGGAGMLGFVKTTAKNTRLTLDFDFGTWLTRFDEPMLHLAGASWSQLLRIPFYEGIGSFPIKTRVEFEQAVANIVAQLAEVEREYLIQLEELMGGSPEWTAEGH